MIVVCLVLLETGVMVRHQVNQESRTYSTSQVAAVIGVHANTIRKYEEWDLITKPRRKKNGYREFSSLQVYQVKLVRTAFRVELVQSNLRVEVVEIVRACARCDFDKALILTEARHSHLVREQKAAKRAAEVASATQVSIVKTNGESGVAACGGGEARPTRHPLASPEAAPLHPDGFMTRSEAAHHLDTTIDCLRSWEMNGLLQVKRRKNGYRVYDAQDINRLALIRTLRMANYSLAAIRRLLEELEANPASDIQQTLNTPKADEDIVSACDQLLSSFDEALRASEEMTSLIKEMKEAIS